MSQGEEHEGTVRGGVGKDHCPAGQLFEKIAQHVPIAIFMLDLEGTFICMNPRVEEFSGYRADELLHKHFSLLFGKETLPLIQEKFNEVALHGKTVVNFEVRGIRKDGKTRVVSLSGMPLVEEGKIRGVVGAAEDITDRKRREEQLKRYADIFKFTNIGIFVAYNMEQTMEMVNPAFAAMHGYTVEELTGKSVFDVYAPEVRDEVPGYIKTAIEEGRHTFESIHIRKDGSLFPVQVDISSIKDDKGRVLYRVVNVQDITERKRAEEIIKYQAYNDLLTGLPNRATLVMYLDREVQKARTEKRQFTVFTIGLDRFKSINETLGHDIGDMLIKDVAERLQHCIQENDIVARISSDIFVLVCMNTPRTEDAAHTAQMLLDTIRKPFQADGYQLYITASIGIAMFFMDGETTEILLKRSSIAMTRAKELGKDMYQFFMPEIHTRTVERLILENRLRETINRHELMLLYQPLINIADGRIVALEALARWKHPDLGLLMPSQFIPVAEEMGFILLLDEWALRTACAQNKAWQDKNCPHFCVTVNLSARQFLQSTLGEKVSEILKETGLAPEWLDIEISESTAMRDINLAVPSMDRLGRIGVSLSIDDFGTGYSSLTYLKKFPVQKLKIDKSFIRDSATDADDQAIIKAVIAMGHSLNLRVAAEGVETNEQLAFLRDAGCDEIQGELYCKPLPADEIERLYLAQQGAVS